MERRKFIKLTALAATSGLFRTQLLGQNLTKNPIKIAICGLGNYAENWIAPAIQASNHAELTGIITGSPNKISKWQKKYPIKDNNIYNYETLDSIADNKDIDCVYIATPTGNHAEFTIRSFEAGKHVICEKPMAPTVSDCDRMIAAAKKANKMLQIGYRLYWDPFNVRLMSATKNKEFGPWNEMRGGFSYDHGRWTRKGDWRLTKAMNVGGAVYDLGVYVVQSAFYTTHLHPVSVLAKSWTDRTEIYKELPEHWEWELEWPDGKVSKHSSSYGKKENFIHLETKKGQVGLKPAYSYRGLAGYEPSGSMDIKAVFQQKLQIDGQCLAIMGQQPNITPGEMGRRDIRVLNAIMLSAKSNQKIKFKGFKY
ncbi:MAG: glucose-fructose oxidoreductase [Flavobacteriaceae bacterium]|nr:glucose-fructose oxidoreductase [Flavobacteriaceae bacterium]